MGTIPTDDLEVEDTTVVELNDKSGNDLLGANGERRTITVWGPGTEQFAKAKAEAKIRNIKNIRNKKADPEGDAAATAAFLSSITISFDNFGIEEADQERKVFREFYLNAKVGYITDQVDAAAGDWANF